MFGDSGDENLVILRSHHGFHDDDPLRLVLRTPP